jgi:hypothetical protein
MEIKFSELNQEQIKEIKKLEEKLHVTLLAYDNFVLEGHNDNSPDVMNPS